jgi:putative AlgH/UPF0301 family transcriptional regulator
MALANFASSAFTIVAMPQILDELFEHTLIGFLGKQKEGYQSGF